MYHIENNFVFNIDQFWRKFGVCVIVVVVVVVAVVVAER